MSGAAIDIRPAVAEDYPEYVRLFRELGIEDPPPDLSTWLAEFTATTWFACRDQQVVGYCYFQQLREHGYVNNVVVDAPARNRGIGRALMTALAERFRAAGLSHWMLNVKPDNLPARALYEGMGMARAYTMKSLRLPWSALAALPVGSAAVHEPATERDADLERALSVTAGQVARMRARGRTILEARDAASDALSGIAVLDPRTERIGVFRADTTSAKPLLEAAHTRLPETDRVFVVIENDDALADLLMTAGASMQIETFRMIGRL